LVYTGHETKCTMERQSPVQILDSCSQVTYTRLRRDSMHDSMPQCACPTDYSVLDDPDRIPRQGHPADTPGRRPPPYQPATEQATHTHTDTRRCHRRRHDPRWVCGSMRLDSSVDSSTGPPPCRTASVSDHVAPHPRPAPPLTSAAPPAIPSPHQVLLCPGPPPSGAAIRTQKSRGDSRRERWSQIASLPRPTCPSPEAQARTRGPRRAGSEFP
jgi:hypothetical protein